MVTPSPLGCATEYVEVALATSPRPAGAASMTKTVQSISFPILNDMTEVSGVDRTAVCP